MIVARRLVADYLQKCSTYPKWLDSTELDKTWSLSRIPVNSYKLNRYNNNRFSMVMGKMRNCGMWNAEGKMRNGKCGKWCGTVGKMRKFAYVGSHLSTVGCTCFWEFEYVIIN